MHTTYRCFNTNESNCAGRCVRISRNTQLNSDACAVANAMSPCTSPACSCVASSACALVVRLDDARSSRDRGRPSAPAPATSGKNECNAVRVEIMSNASHGPRATTGRRETYRDYPRKIPPMTEIDCFARACHPSCSIHRPRLDSAATDERRSADAHGPHRIECETNRNTRIAALV